MLISTCSMVQNRPSRASATFLMGQRLSTALISFCSARWRLRYMGGRACHLIRQIVSNDQVEEPVFVDRSVFRQDIVRDAVVVIGRLVGFFAQSLQSRVSG